MTDKFLMFEEIYMNFKMVHENYNVFDLKKSLDFYEKALGLKEVRRKEAVALTIYQWCNSLFYIIYYIFKVWPLFIIQPLRLQLQVFQDRYYLRKHSLMFHQSPYGRIFP